MITYKKAALKGWNGLVSKVDEKARLHDVCVGTGAINSKEFYMTRPKVVGDLHGQTALMWAATGILRME